MTFLRIAHQSDRSGANTHNCPSTQSSPVPSGSSAFAFAITLALTLQDRDHLTFVCKLQDYVSDRKQLLDRIPGALEQAGLTVEEAELSDAERYLEKDYFKNTKLVDLQSGHQRTCDVHPASGSVAPGSQRAVNPSGSER